MREHPGQENEDVQQDLAPEDPVPTTVPEAQGDRLFHVGLEYWKSELDFYKQLITMNLAAVAVFGAILGGVFKDPEVWTPPSSFRSIFILTIFASFIGSALLCMDATVHARANILRMRHVYTEEQLGVMVNEFRMKWPTSTPLYLWPLQGRKFVRQSLASQLLFLLGLAAFAAFAVFSMPV